MERVICLLIGYVFGLFQTAEPYSVPDIRRIFICCACTPVQELSSDITSRFTWDLREEKESLPLQV